MLQISIHLWFRKQYYFNPRIMVLFDI